MRVGVVGNGYVGSGMVRMFKDAFNVGIYDNARHMGGYGDKEAVRGADLAIICVPTPEGTYGNADTSAVEEVVSWVEAELILIKSTVPPGTTDYLGRKYHKTLHFSPEYMGEPKNFVPPWKYPDPRDARTHGHVIVGGPRASEILSIFARVMSTDAHYVSCSNLEAELTKYMENAFLATKVAFCHEFAEIAEAFDVDYMKLRELWLLDPRMGRDHTMVFPGQRGFGGKCLPKDLSAIVRAAETVGASPRILREVLLANRERTSA